jgi:Ca2+ transporting ATPase
MVLVFAITLSMILHFIIIYTPVLAMVFSTVPLGWDEWQIVLGWSIPIIFIDEALKYVERSWFMAKAEPVFRRKKID